MDLRWNFHFTIQILIEFCQKFNENLHKFVKLTHPTQGVVSLAKQNIPPHGRGAFITFAPSVLQAYKSKIPSAPSSLQGVKHRNKSEGAFSRFFQSVNLWIFLLRLTPCNPPCRYAQYDKIQTKVWIFRQKNHKFNFLNAKIKAFPRTKYFRWENDFCGHRLE